MAATCELAAQSKTYPLMEIQGIRLRVPYPDDLPGGAYVRRGDTLDRALAAWLTLDGLPPLNFRLYGPPGVGKNALVYECARVLGKPLYSMVGHLELGPEDVACSARITSVDTIEYVASPLLAAMLHGGIFFFDEIAKAPPAALNPLASVLDERRTLTSVLAGIQVRAHPEFRFCAALNEDEELGGVLPPFIQERLIPSFRVGIPTRDELSRILMSQLATVGRTWIDLYLNEFWRPEETSPRDAAKHLQFAYGLAAAVGQRRPSEEDIGAFLRKATGKECEAKSVGAPPAEVRPTVSVREKANDDQPVLAPPRRRRATTIH
jgi:MoxR-like ATPase